MWGIKFLKFQFENESFTVENFQDPNLGMKYFCQNIAPCHQVTSSLWWRDSKTL